MDRSENAGVPLERTLRALGVLMGVLLPVYAWTVVQAPIDSVQGVMQKILYVHPPLAYGAYLGFVATAIGGALFLWRGEERHDQLAVAGAEVGTIFCTLMLVTGPIWARGAWGPGNWWVWDARLTLTLLLWFVYLAYLLLRSFTEGDERAARFASVYGILGVVLIPLNYWIIDLDEDYRWAVVGHPGRDYLWILSREPTLDPEVYEGILERLRAQHYDTARLVRTLQPVPSAEG